MLHLVLLVGENALPNYIVARYSFTQEDLTPGEILLLCTERTKGVAVHLQKSLVPLANVYGSSLSVKTCTIQAPYSDNEVQKQFKDIFESDPTGKIHLNYTGGTKVMAIQARQAAANLDKKSQFFFSYLDADDFKLRFDQNYNMGRLDSEDLRLMVTMDSLESLEAITALHGWQLKTVLLEPVYKESAEWLLQLACRESFDYKTVSGWFRTALSKKNQDPGPPPTVLGNFPLLLQTEFSVNLEETISGSSENLKKLAGFLRGAWLEQAVFQEVWNPNRREENKITFCAANICLKRNSSNTVELDVVTLQGYQLTLFSCTTAGYFGWEKDASEEVHQGMRAILKGKAFEALHRAKQLGGEEARVVLLTLADQEMINDLNEDLREALGEELTEKGSDFFKLTILGRRDLTDLSSTLTEVFKS